VIIIIITNIATIIIVLISLNIAAPAKEAIKYVIKIAHNILTKITEVTTEDGVAVDAISSYLSLS
jgi:hypothetical protein